MMIAQARADDGARWVSDQIEVDVRRGQSTRHAIIRMLPGGTRVELLETDANSGYSRVRTPSGAEGWVLARYLMTAPPARLKLPQAEAELRESRERQAALAEELSGLRRERDGLRREVESLTAAREGLAKDLAELRALSAGTIEVAEHNRALTARATAAEQRLGELDALNRELAAAGQRGWFLAGAGVLGGGLFLGLVLPRIRWRRKSAWGDRF